VLGKSFGPACPVWGVASEEEVGMSTIATIHVLCETNPSLGTAVVNGLLAWATVLGGSTTLGAGLPAALVALDTTRADLRADLINRGIGVGFLFGMAAGALLFFVFVARLVS
jgi:hypothetical protein